MQEPHLTQIYFGTLPHEKSESVMWYSPKNGRPAVSPFHFRLALDGLKQNAGYWVYRNKEAILYCRQQGHLYIVLPVVFFWDLDNLIATFHDGAFVIQQDVPEDVYFDRLRRAIATFTVDKIGIPGLIDAMQEYNKDNPTL